ncbi:hypothetical protein CSKR_109874 [Clonorchis sinensis]|uniref:Uncharacterized protein n=1 Tax=Clonorchis sinensis TaxID=79923 RepID=A0A419PP23_CLOSI|nr:hypothetical protein CSKR_109874 [Clonorchis sinensis]
MFNIWPHVYTSLSQLRVYRTSHHGRRTGRSSLLVDATALQLCGLLRVYGVGKVSLPTLIT